MTIKKTKDAGVQEVERYLSQLPNASRATLEQLRRTIKSVVPEAIEVISYQIPTFKHNGRMLVSYAGFRDHCSFFPGAGPIETHKRELESFPTSKGTIRFTPEEPLPATLVKKLVKTRIKLNDAAEKKKRLAT